MDGGVIQAEEGQHGIPLVALGGGACLCMGWWGAGLDEPQKYLTALLLSCSPAQGGKH